MAELKLLVFDWDGTLMNSQAQIVGCMQGAIADLGLAPRDADAICEIIGLGLREAIATLYPDEPQDLVEAVADRYRHHWLACGPETAALFPGAEQTLRLLHEEGFLLGVATGKSRRGLDKVLRETGLGDLFHASRCADESGSKPDPAMLNEIMAELAAPAVETVMIGDTEYDMLMARNAGTHAVAVSYGAHDAERLRRHRPLVCLDRISELGDWLAEQRSAVAADAES